MMSILFLPQRSESIPAGMLAMIPVNAETAAIMPTPDASAPRCCAKSGSTGLFEIVELKIARKPVIQRVVKGVMNHASGDGRDKEKDRNEFPSSAGTPFPMVIFS